MEYMIYFKYRATRNESGRRGNADGSDKLRKNLLTVPGQGARRTSSGSLQSVSDESDTEPSPPVSRRERRQAFPSIFDSKSLGISNSPDDISPSNSCDEGEGNSAAAAEKPENRTRRKRSSVDLGINYPGDLLVQERQRKKVLIKRNTIADFAATRSYAGSTASLYDQDSKKVKGTFSFLKLIDKKTRSKDVIAALDVVLQNIKPSHFKDNNLLCYKDVHWSELIASQDQSDKDALNISENERKRREAVWELFKSELVFLTDHLMVLKHCFMEPLKKVQVDGHLMFAEPQDLFSNLDELCYVSHTFCRDFISLLLKNVSAEAFGKTEVLIKAFQRFTQHSRNGEVYHSYCLNYSKAITYLEQLSKNDDFCEFEKWCEQDARCKRLQLTDLLISPMQHCTKMPLLLSNIRKYTEDSDERQQLTEELEELETSLKNLEAKMKWLKNFERVQEIQQQIVWQPITEIDPRAFIPEFLRSSFSRQPCERLLASPKRQLLYEGQLTLLEVSKTIEMYLFLFDDILLLTRIKKPPRKRSSSSDMNHMGAKAGTTEGAVFVVHRQPVALDRFTMHDVRPPDASANGLRNAFVLVQITRFQQVIGVYTLQAPSESVKTTWVTQLKEAQEKFKEACTNSRRNSAAVNIEENQGTTQSSATESPKPRPIKTSSFKEIRAQRERRVARSASNIERQRTIEEREESEPHLPPHFLVNITSSAAAADDFDQLASASDECQDDAGCCREEDTILLQPKDGADTEQRIEDRLEQPAEDGDEIDKTLPDTDDLNSLGVTALDSPLPQHRRSFSHIRHVAPLQAIHEKSKSVDVVYI